MKLKLNMPAVLIDISGIAEMNNISEDGGDIVIGANWTHKVILNSDLFNKHINVLAPAAGMIGDIQVRNRGTIGGSLAHVDPASDYPDSVLAAEATFEVEA